MRSARTILMAICATELALFNVAKAQPEEALWRQLMTPVPRVIALLSEGKVDLWETIQRSSPDALRKLASEHKLRIILPTTEDGETVVLVDAAFLKPSQQYELEVLNLSTESLSHQKYFKLGDLSEEQQQLILEWLERHAPVRFLNIRALEARYHDVIIYPVGLVRAEIELEDKRVLSGYIAEVYPSEESPLEFAKKQLHQSPSNYEELEIDQYRQRLIDMAQQWSRGMTAKINIFSIGVSQQELNEIVANTLSKCTAEAVEEVQRQSQLARERLKSLLHEACANRLGEGVVGASSLEELPEIAKSAVIEMLKSEGLSEKSIGNLRVELCFGIVIGVVNKHTKYYNIQKIDLDERRFAGMERHFIGTNPSQ